MESFSAKFAASPHEHVGGGVQRRGGAEVRDKSREEAAEVVVIAVVFGLGLEAVNDYLYLVFCFVWGWELPFLCRSILIRNTICLNSV